MKEIKHKIYLTNNPLPLVPEGYKICSICEETKEKQKFRRGRQCRECERKCAKEYRENNKEKVQERLKKYRDKNREKINESSREYRKQSGYVERYKEYYQKNKEKINKNSTEWQRKNRDKVNNARQEYRNNNRERVNEIARRGAKKNRPKIREYRRKKYQTDPEYRLRVNLRGRFSVRNLQGGKKSDKTMNIIGCSVKKLMEHLESQFEDGMTWDNYRFDVWHVDHKVPLAFFDLTKPRQQQMCFNYTNLQPLWSKKNISKGAGFNYYDFMELKKYFEDR
uniref:Uncharacterized protein n=1 Tax=Marseillevirus LCMAC101 TaxID=2506602 RepID=A0A481YT51_9VIRU|nr:MAG: hypothetical protein LCMAC101_06760 [Marseillevirus LCMAC101]